MLKSSKNKHTDKIIGLIYNSKGDKLYRYIRLM